MRCINIDWLQVYGRCGDSRYLELKLKSIGYKIECHDQSTRHFKTWITATRPGDKFSYAEITYNPFSTIEASGGIFHADACIVKLSNRYCYEPECVNKFREFLSSWDFSLISVSRLDICCDLEYFDNRMLPSTLIKGYFSCLYWKMRPTKSKSIQDQYTDIRHSYISFGDGTTPVSVKMYNKSLEMEQVKSKPYIKDAWKECRIGNKRDVWRLELSIKPDRKNMINKEYGDIVELKIGNIDTPNKLMETFFRYQQHYFKFKVNDGKTKKKNAKILELFHLEQNVKNYTPLRLTSVECTGRTDKMILARMYEMSYHESLSEEERRTIERAMFSIAKVKRISIGEINKVKKLNNKKK